MFSRRYYRQFGEGLGEVVRDDGAEPPAPLKPVPSSIAPSAPPPILSDVETELDEDEDPLPESIGRRDDHVLEKKSNGFGVRRRAPRPS